MMLLSRVIIYLFSSILCGLLCNQNFVALMMPSVGRLVYRSLMSRVISFMCLLVCSLVIFRAIYKEFFILYCFVLFPSSLVFVEKFGYFVGWGTCIIYHRSDWHALFVRFYDHIELGAPSL